MQKKKSGVKKCLEILPLRGGGVRPLMANAILNFHFDFLHPSLTCHYFIYQYLNSSVYGVIRYHRFFSKVENTLFTGKFHFTLMISHCQLPRTSGDPWDQKDNCTKDKVNVPYFDLPWPLLATRSDFYGSKWLVQVSRM